MNDIDVQDHFGLVGLVAGPFAKVRCGQCLHDTDEWGDGMLGLAQAKIAFKPELGLKFSTLGTKCIFGEICKGKDYRRRHNPPIKSLDALIGGKDSEDDNTYYSTLLDKNYGRMDPLEARDLVEYILSALDERTRFILRRRIMERVPLKDLARETGLSQEWIRQIEKKGIEKAARFCGRELLC